LLGQRRSKKKPNKEEKKYFCVFHFIRKTQKKNQKTKGKKNDMVSNIYIIIMVQKLRNEFGIGNLKLLERRGCRGIPKTRVLLVLALFFFLIMSCFIPIKRNVFIFMILLVPAKGLVLQTDNIYNCTQDASSTNY
jgi:hypothetical protein